MDEDTDMRSKGMTRAKLMSGYAWIAAGLIGLAGAAICIVGIALYAWGQR